MTQDLEAIIYPTGRMNIPGSFSEKGIYDAIQDIKVLPRILDYTIENMDAAQLETPYREGGWTPNQIIHHIADSHMNAFVRTKLALTEDTPVIKPYSQDDWALTVEVAEVPVNYSITLLHAMHHRWTVLLASLDEAAFKRSYYHPEYNKTVTLWELVHTYAWHGRHHAEQVRQLRVRMDW
jgi:hypothetical protein